MGLPQFLQCPVISSQSSPHLHFKSNQHVSSKDVIKSLQILTGSKPFGIDTGNDVDKDTDWKNTALYLARTDNCIVEILKDGKPTATLL